MRSRYFSLIFVFVVVVLIWSGYLFCIQILDPFNLSHLRLVRYIPHKDILIPRRGSIYDAKGNLLVSSISYYQVDIDRAAVRAWAIRNKKDVDETMDKVAQSIIQNSSLNEDFVYKRLNMGNKTSSIQISNKISEAELDNILQAFRQQELPGLIHSFSHMRRTHSKGILAARLMGSVREASNGYDPVTNSKSLYKLAGINGLEATYDKILAGEYGWREVVLDANGKPVPYPDLHEKKPKHGNNIYLTIDAQVQEVVENVLYEGVQKYEAKHGGAVVMDPKTGRVLALAGVSNTDLTDDPNIVRSKSNIPASFMFEPGSTMKPITLLPALEHKLIRHNEYIECGRYQVGRRTIRDTHDYGPLTPRGIIAKSSNVGVAKIAERIGKTRLYEEFISMGFGQKSALNLFGESSGLFAKLENWDGYSLHSLSFGQSISVTAIQLAAAYSAMANGGKLMKPTIVDSYRDDNGKIIESFDPVMLRQVSSKAACDTMLSYIQEVVDDGTARHIQMNYISMGGKTGTAEKNVEGTRGYSSGKYNAVFVGLFPVEDPQMVIVVFYDEPSHYYRFGSMSAAPSFRKIVENILFMPDCRILPYNERLMQSSLTMPNLVGESIYNAEKTLNRYGFLYKVEGPDSASTVIDQFPKAGIYVDKNHPITLKLGKGSKETPQPVAKGNMPNLVGMTLRKATQTAAEHKVPIRIEGSGIVRKQSLLPGSLITQQSVCILEASL